ncbi:hypothetical protein LTS18_000249 [Coniosporium uncinatum]|uniref:Uncharacterized protein n=1 Tax=Coniosporium uncinatum TaxID=93489 RepID=A0ACC3D888_9PEZI|nr:hypothetical protein LTS18_000249 [Coniosporium uncinatum]
MTPPPCSHQGSYNPVSFATRITGKQRICGSLLIPADVREWDAHYAAVAIHGGLHRRRILPADAQKLYHRHDTRMAGTPYHEVETSESVSQVLRHKYFDIEMRMDEDGYVRVPQMDCTIPELEQWSFTFEGRRPDDEDEEPVSPGSAPADAASHLVLAPRLEKVDLIVREDVLDRKRSGDNFAPQRLTLADVVSRSGIAENQALGSS